MSGAPGAIWKILEWDSEFFGFRIARVFAAPSAAAIALAVEQCPQQQVRCLYFLAETADTATIRLLEQQGFGFADVRLTLIQRAPVEEHLLEIPNVRYACAEDLPALKRIARISHHDSRFYADPNFPRSRCDALYEAWIAKSCNEGFADVVFVAETAGGEAGGYITCTMIQPDRGQIGLLAVAPEARGSGAGRRLIQQALCWAQSRGAASVITVTQGGNVSAVRVYERCGFVAERSQLWYHRWFDAGAIGEV
jgi:dTDP-4-amino-4,6-dideoxy-D-galactose acyltransferase